jgi:hypothetical protein
MARDPSQPSPAAATVTTSATADASRGQQVVRTVKIKDTAFPNDGAFQAYVRALVDAQEGLCALTDLPLEYDGSHDDEAMLCSLDRIDSNGHYAPGNLQVVCRFANKWKGASDDVEFRRLVGVVRGDETGPSYEEAPSPPKTDKGDR